MNLPIEFLEKMQNLLGQEYSDYIESFNETRYHGLRANTIKINKDQLKNILENQKESVSLSEVQWCDTGFYYPEDFRAAKLPYYNVGLYYIQEPSAMSTVSVLKINEGDKILDLCAAPGGKTTQAAAKLKGTGLIVANDISTTRCKGLIKNIEVSGITNAVITNESPQSLEKVFNNFFDKIIVDAPCSGEGMFRKEPKLIKEWTKDSYKQYTQWQKEILTSAAKMLKPSGELVYSTCTFEQEENENIINWFLANNPSFEIIPIQHELYGFSKGIGNENCARLFPHKVKGEGHFLAHLRKKGEAVENMVGTVKAPKGVEIFYDFSEKYLNKEFKGNFHRNNDALYLVPYELPDLKGCRIMRSGFYLGEIKNNRFEPSQALASGLKMEECKITVNLKIDDERVSRYLKGESFEVDCKDGYALVCLEGFSLGFGKVVSGRLKNKYLWRI